MDRLVALHRHWIIADAVRVVIEQRVITPEQEESAIKKLGIEYLAFGEHASMICRMQVWYALLYVVEGYRELGRRYDPLDKVLERADYVDLLRRFSNATFHFQGDVLNDKLIDFLEKEDSEFWIRDLNKQLDAFLTQSLPIREASEKMKNMGVQQIPPGTKLSTLLQFGRK